VLGIEPRCSPTGRYVALTRDKVGTKFAFVTTCHESEAIDLQVLLCAGGGTRTPDTRIMIPTKQARESAANSPETCPRNRAVQTNVQTIARVLSRLSGRLERLVAVACGRFGLPWSRSSAAAGTAGVAPATGGASIVGISGTLRVDSLQGHSDGWIVASIPEVPGTHSDAVARRRERAPSTPCRPCSRPTRDWIRRTPAPARVPAAAILL
jgi:hypothetical protein